MANDYEVWHALHDLCPPDGCGGCVVVDIDLDDDLLAAVERSGLEFDVFISQAIELGMRREARS